MKSPSRSVLLIAGIDALSIGRLPRLFAEAGYSVHLLGSDRLVAAGSRFVAERIPAPPGADAAARLAADHLARRRGEYDRILLADEPVLWAALDLGPSAWMQDWFPVPLTAPAIARLRSKTTFLCDCRDAGIATPHFQVCTNANEIRETANSIGFPVFIKAYRGLAGSGLLFARDRSDLDAQRSRISFDNPVVIQAEIRGESGSISVLYDRGVPVCWFSYLVARSWPNRFSAACAIRMFPHPDAAALTAAVGRLTQFTGLAGIDFVRDPEADRLILLEFNPRPTPVYHLGPRAGVDFRKALRDTDCGASEPQIPGDSTAGIELFPQSLFESFEHFRPAKFIEAFRDAPWDEKKLVASHLRRFLSHYLPNSLKDRVKGRIGNG
jgi:predicted ATP-grasp superfamily ATP-dependent carboligase